MTNPIIERVAKAIIAAIEKQCEERDDYMSDDHEGVICVDGYLRPADIAHAAIEAMHEPTEAMEEVFTGPAPTDWRLPREWPFTLSFAELWSEAIDAALKEN